MARWVVKPHLNLSSHAKQLFGLWGFARKQAPTLTDNKSNVYKITRYER